MKVYVQSIIQKHKSCSADTSGDQVSTTTKTPKTADLSNLEVSEFITCHKMKMKNKDEFFAVAHIQNEQGKKKPCELYFVAFIKTIEQIVCLLKMVRGCL